MAILEMGAPLPAPSNHTSTNVGAYTKSSADAVGGSSSFADLVNDLADNGHGSGRASLDVDHPRPGVHRLTDSRNGRQTADGHTSRSTDGQDVGDSASADEPGVWNSSGGGRRLRSTQSDRSSRAASAESDPETSDTLGSGSQSVSTDPWRDARRQVPQEQALSSDRSVNHDVVDAEGGSEPSGLSSASQMPYVAGQLGAEGVARERGTLRADGLGVSAIPEASSAARAGSGVVPPTGLGQIRGFDDVAIDQAMTPTASTEQWSASEQSGTTAARSEASRTALATIREALGQMSVPTRSTDASANASDERVVLMVSTEGGTGSSTAGGEVPTRVTPLLSTPFAAPAPPNAYDDSGRTDVPNSRVGRKRDVTVDVRTGPMNPLAGGRGSGTTHASTAASLNGSPRIVDSPDGSGRAGTTSVSASTDGASPTGASSTGGPSGGSSAHAVDTASAVSDGVESAVAQRAIQAFRLSEQDVATAGAGAPELRAHAQMTSEASTPELRALRGQGGEASTLPDAASASSDGSTIGSRIARPVTPAIEGAGENSAMTGASSFRHAMDDGLQSRPLARGTAIVASALQVKDANARERLRQLSADSVTEEDSLRQAATAVTAAAAGGAAQGVLASIATAGQAVVPGTSTQTTALPTSTRLSSDSIRRHARHASMLDAGGLASVSAVPQPRVEPASASGPIVGTRSNTDASTLGSPSDPGAFKSGAQGSARLSEEAAAQDWLSDASPNAVLHDRNEASQVAGSPRGGRTPSREVSPTVGPRVSGTAAIAIAAFQAVAAAASQPVSTSTGAASAASAVSTAMMDSRLPGQIVQAIRLRADNGNGQVHLRLNPEYLGDVSVDVRVNGTSVVASVQASSADVREWLRQNETLLRQTLAEQGMHLDRFTVVEDDAASSSRDQPNEQRGNTSDEPPLWQRRSKRPRETGTFEVVL